MIKEQFNKLSGALSTAVTRLNQIVALQRLTGFESLNPQLPFETLMTLLDSENRRYDYLTWVFLRRAPKELRRHRMYFSKNGRGFGEDAMHGMWWLLLRDFKPQRMLEIGVYRGQTISLWKLIAQITNQKMEIWGLSPLSKSGDEVSTYDDIDYESDIQQNFAVFGLGRANLKRGLSTDDESKSFVSKEKWDIIYLDGSHDYKVVKQDFSLASKSLTLGGLLVLDDASLDADYKPKRGSFAGHPGPSLVAKEVSQDPSFLEIGTCGHNRIYKKIR
jgi:predicted O-methyltransferase YrrM